jgi:hypothetical protein
MIDIIIQVAYFTIFCLTFAKSGTYVDYKGSQRPKKQEVAIIPIVCTAYIFSDYGLQLG